MTSQEYENVDKEAHGFDSDTLRYSWAGYLLFIITSSLIGDTIILVGSTKYKVIKLHRMIVVVIQHIAVCDLLISVTDVLPKFISVIANKQVFKHSLCHLSPYTVYFSNSASVFLICIMTTGKMLLLINPLRFGVTTEKKSHGVCAACWLASFTIPVVFLLVDRQDIHFTYQGYSCNYGYSSSIYQWLRPLLAALFSFIPTCLVVATTIALLIIARKFASRNRGNLRWQGTITAVLTATIYCISIFPVFMYTTMRSIMKEGDIDNLFFKSHGYRITKSFMFLNTISNFYIYSLTVASFREFVWSRLQQSYRYIKDVGSTTFNNGE
jgi:hypothetical protein